MTLVHLLKIYVKPCFSGRARFGLTFGKMSWSDFGPAHKLFSQRRTLLTLGTTVEVIEWIKSSRKMINCALHSHLYFATSSVIGSFG